MIFIFKIFASFQQALFEPGAMMGKMIDQCLKNASGNPRLLGLGILASGSVSFFCAVKTEEKRWDKGRPPTCQKSLGIEKRNNKNKEKQKKHRT